MSIDNENIETAAQIAAGLRTLATWCEKNPEVAARMYFSSYSNNLTVNVDGKDELKKVVTSGGYWEKNADSYTFDVTHKFGPIVFTVSTSRDDTCAKIVTGTEDVEMIADQDALNAAIRALRDAAPKITKTVEKTEWKCPSLLD